MTVWDMEPVTCLMTCNQSSARFLLQAEGVQVVAVRRLPVGSRSVGEDEHSDGRHQQGAWEAILRAGGPVRSEAHAGRQPGHGGRRHHLPHLREARKTTVWCHGLWKKRWFILTCTDWTPHLDSVVDGFGSIIMFIVHQQQRNGPV